jgi:hypothetical protein
MLSSMPSHTQTMPSSAPNEGGLHRTQLFEKTPSPTSVDRSGAELIVSRSPPKHAQMVLKRRRKVVSMTVGDEKIPLVFRPGKEDEYDFCVAPPQEKENHPGDDKGATESSRRIWFPCQPDNDFPNPSDVPPAIYIITSFAMRIRTAGVRVGLFGFIKKI